MAVTGKQSMNSLFKRTLQISFLLITISSVQQWTKIPIGNTTIWWCIQAIILYCFIKMRPAGYNIKIINIFLFYLCISALYGATLMAHSYWDWKLLVNNLLIFSLALSSYTFSNPITLSKVQSIWYKYCWVIIIPLMPFLESDAFGRIFVPFTFLSLFLPLLNKKYILIIIVTYLITITYGSDSRSDMIKYTICILLGIFLYIQNKKLNFLRKLYKPIFLALLVTPFIFFILGVTHAFNIFRIEEELGIKDKYTFKSHESENEYSALTDTRTFLYVEQITSAIKHDYLLLGHSIARGHESTAFGSTSKSDSNGLGERASCEVSILNIFNYFGVIGVIIYFLIFFQASYKAIFKTNNSYLPIIGIYIAFRWNFSWIEDFSKFDLNYLFLWIMIGICYSPIYRQMNNQQFALWIKNIIH
jgi:hypothetical protein